MGFASGETRKYCGCCRCCETLSNAVRWVLDKPIIVSTIFFVGSLVSLIVVCCLVVPDYWASKDYRRGGDCQVTYFGNVSNWTNCDGCSNNEYPMCWGPSYPCFVVNVTYFDGEIETTARLFQRALESFDVMFPSIFITNLSL